MLKVMKKMFKMQIQRKLVFILFAFHLFFAVLLSVLSILGQPSLQTDYALLDTPFSILIVLSLSQNQFDQRELILCGISRRQLVFSRFIGRFAVLLFCFCCTFSGYIFAPPETKLVVLFLFLLMLIRECLCIPLVLSMNRTQTYWNAVVVLIVGATFVACWLCPKLALMPQNQHVFTLSTLKTLLIVLGAVLAVSVPVSMTLCQRMFAKKDI